MLVGQRPYDLLDANARYSHEIWHTPAQEAK
jgi:hypothetical protein